MLGKSEGNMMTLMDDSFHNDYLSTLQHGGREHSAETERNAFDRMQADIEKEKDMETRQFMVDTVVHYCKDCSMLLSYILNEYWHVWIRDYKRKKKKVSPLELYIDLERIMSMCCDSTSYTKQSISPRKTLTIPGNHSGEERITYVNKGVSNVGLLNSYFEFGSHKFFVGQAISGMVSHLEERYGLDFDKLERARQRAKEGE